MRRTSKKKDTKAPMTQPTIPHGHGDPLVVICDDCGARIADGIAHTFEACELRQRTELLRHIRDELRRLNIHVESIAVAAKVANAYTEDLRTFYGKVIDERRRARNAVLRRIEDGAITKAARRGPIDRAKTKRPKVHRR